MPHAVGADLARALQVLPPFRPGGPYIVFLNVVLLFLVLFFVHPLKFVSTLVSSQLTGSDIAQGAGRSEASSLMRIYAAGSMALFTLFALMYLHAYRLRNALGLSPVEALETRFAIQENAIMVAVRGISFALAFKYP